MSVVIVLALGVIIAPLHLRPGHCQFPRPARQQCLPGGPMTAMPDCSSSRNVKGLLYVRGLLLDGRRKSMQPMAERLGIDHQRLQQFMTSSTWPVEDVRARLAWRAVAVVRPEVWVVDDTGFPKDGTASPGVARQYSGTLGKVGNCQIGVSVHAASDTASCPLSWRLFLPAAWDGPESAARREACRIPDTEYHRPKCRS
ncbi:transposase [Streptomyces sp. NPDC088097]|uniref:IS701 family transposase n=1 Tax=Streptomyces sp. NPDC088097 TaxID=3365823 RepID=UPI003817E3C7